jgi:lysophospholipase L1-like esterase
MIEDERPRLEAGQTVLFVGDHAPPDEGGYVALMGDVLRRFHPNLALNLIRAGSPLQTAAGIASERFLALVTSSRPDWLSLSLGLADASREPELSTLVADYRRTRQARESDADSTIGHSHHPGGRLTVEQSSGHAPPTSTESWQLLPAFRENLAEAISKLVFAGVRPVLHTPIAVGDDTPYPLNLALKAYARVIRELAREFGAVLVDDDRAFRDLLDRATTYKQHVALADWGGRVNPQGEALLSRAFLQAFGLLPHPGQRRGSSRG